MKGFTLIELLAVIVILVIIFMIATHQVLKIIDESRKNSFEKSVVFLLDIVETEHVRENINGVSSEKNYEIIDGQLTGDIFEFKGSLPDKGNIIVHQDGKIEAVLFNEGWCAVKSLESKDIHIIEVSEDACSISNMNILISIAMGEENSEANIIYKYNSYFDSFSAKEYSEMYTSLDDYENPISSCGAGETNYDGNYRSHRCLASGAESTRLNQQTNNWADRILSGTNVYQLAQPPSKNDSWIGVFLFGSCYTTSISYSNVKINFSDGYSGNIKNAIDAGYLSPFLIYGSSTSYTSYYFTDTLNLILGDRVTSKSYANVYIYVKPLNKNIESIELTASKSSALYSTCSDGLHVIEYPNLNLSPVSVDNFSLDYPNINIGKEEETITKGSYFTENTVTVFDYKDGDLGPNVEINGFVNYDELGQYTLTFSSTNSQGNRSEKTKIINVIEKPYYGDKTETLVNELYSIVDEFQNPVASCGSSSNYFTGNYQYATCLSRNSHINKLSQENNNSRERILAGTHTYTLINPIIYNNNWLKIELVGGCWTGTNQYSNLLLNFQNGYSGTIEEAIENGYIHPSVIYSSSASSSSYIFPTPELLLNGGGTGSRSYSDFYVYIRPVGYNLESITVTSNISSGIYSVCSDGFAAYELLNFDLSIFDRTTLQIQNPFITAEKNSDIITVGTNFVEQNLKAFDYQDFDITSEISISGFFDNNSIGTYNFNYNVTDSDGNNATPFPKTVEIIPKGTYESNQSTNLSNMYVSSDGFLNPFAGCGTSTNYFNGNYQHGICLINGTFANQLNKQTNKTRDRILAGTNTYEFEKLPTNGSNWLRILLYGNCYTSTNYYSNITLNFSDGYSGHINQSIADDYLEDFVIYGSSAPSSSYIFPSTINALSGGSTGTRSYSNFYAYVKPKDKTLESISLYSNISSGLYSTCGDGLDVFEIMNFDLSTTPN